MRVDDAGPRTWILAALAGWGLLVWVLALFGMGGHIAPRADDPTMLKPLPGFPASPANRLGPIAQYGEFATRPLFSVDRRPKPFSLKSDADGGADAQAFDYVLTSVMLTPNLQLAILQPPDGSTSVRVKLGEAPESHPQWRLSQLDARRAVFDGPGEQRTLDLRVFDGKGGQPPTAIGGDAQAGGPIAMPDAGGFNTATGAPKPAVFNPPPASQPSAATPPRPTPTPAKPGTPAPPAAQTSSTTEQAQMEAIRQRIQARRAQMRQSPPPKPVPSQ